MVELLIVVGIIGVLSAAILMTLNPIDQIQKGRDAQRKSDLSQIQKALESYYQDNGRYPSHSNYKIVRLDGSVADWGSAWQPYMAKLPKDSQESGSRRYIYYAGSDGQSYRLYSDLERGSKDPQACAGVCSGAASITELDSICAGGCNYGVTSPNVSP